MRKKFLLSKLPCLSCSVLSDLSKLRQYPRDPAHPENRPGPLGNPARLSSLEEKDFSCLLRVAFSSAFNTRQGLHQMYREQVTRRHSGHQEPQGFWTCNVPHPASDGARAVSFYLGLEGPVWGRPGRLISGDVGRLLPILLMRNLAKGVAKVCPSL